MLLTIMDSFFNLINLYPSKPTIQLVQLRVSIDLALISSCIKELLAAKNMKFLF